MLASVQSFEREREREREREKGGGLSAILVRRILAARM
jgi:hypothetical protein